MSRFRLLRRRPVLLAGVLTFVTALAVLAVSAGAVAPIGPSPTPDHSVTLSASPVVGLANGSTVTFTVNASGGTTLVGNISAHICQHGFTNYGASNFGYDGSFASRCVYQGNLVSGTLAGSDYEKVYGPYAGSETTSGPLTFKVGTGTVYWGTDDGFGPFGLIADTSHPVDLVIQANLSGDSVPVTYFVQPLSLGTVVTAPAAPTLVTAAPRPTTNTHTGGIAVKFVAGANGGSAITKYTATCKSSNGGVTKSEVHNGAAVAPIIVPGATLKKHYTCRVTATNAIGTSAASAASADLTVGAPAQVSLPVASKIGKGKLKVSFNNLSGAQVNGSALTKPQYTATCLSGDGGAARAATGTRAPIGVKGLTPGKHYRCRVKAHNARGFSQDSRGSVAVKA